MLTGAHVAPGASDGAFIAAEIFGGDHAAATSLNELLDHLLGGGSRIQADAGLSRFCQQRLAVIKHGAEAQSLECLHGLQAMSLVLGVALEHPGDALSMPVLADVAWHFHVQLHAVERWRELAENASGLLENQRVAGDVAHCYVSWARSIGEWPESENQGPGL